MKTKRMLLAAGGLAVVCLGLAAVVLLFQVQGAPLPFLRGLTPARDAQAAAGACP